MKAINIFNILLLLCLHKATAQNSLQDSIRLFEWEKYDLVKRIERIDSLLEPLRIKRIENNLSSIGNPVSPKDIFIHNGTGYRLGVIKDANIVEWAFHIISRNLFGTTRVSERDSAIKSLKNFSTISVIPLADIKWSERITSDIIHSNYEWGMDSTFYANIWVPVEDALRSSFYLNKTKLAVITGTFGHYFYKTAITMEDSLQNGIAFLVDEKESIGLIENYTLTIDSLEAFTGMDFYPNLPDSIEAITESTLNLNYWFFDKKNEKAPLTKFELPRGTLNTLQANHYKNLNREVTVCGFVVSSTETTSKNIILNLDRPFPNEIFSVIILKEDAAHFPIHPKAYFENERACFTGKVNDFNGSASMRIKRKKYAYLLN